MKSKNKNVSVNIQFVENQYDEKESTAEYQQLFSILSMIGKNTATQYIFEKSLYQ